MVFEWFQLVFQVIFRWLVCGKREFVPNNCGFLGSEYVPSEPRPRNNTFLASSSGRFRMYTLEHKFAHLKLYSTAHVLFISGIIFVSSDHKQQPPCHASLFFGCLGGLGSNDDSLH